MFPKIHAKAVNKYKNIKFFHVFIPLIFIQTSQFRMRDAAKSPVNPIAAVVINSCQAFGTKNMWFCGIAQKMKQLLARAKMSPVPTDQRYFIGIFLLSPSILGIT